MSTLEEVEKNCMYQIASVEVSEREQREETKTLEKQRERRKK